MAKIELDIKQALCAENPCYKLDQPLAVRGLMLHSVGCPQPDAMVFIRQFNRPDFKRACVHAFIDANTGDIYQTLPWEMRGWHAGGAANGSHIGVEMCEPPNIRYRGVGSAFDCADPKAAAEYVTRTYNSAVRLFAWLCRRFALYPADPKVIISHREGHAAGVASNHGDPEHLWQGLGLPYTMDGFRRDITALLSAPTPYPETLKSGCYRVRRSWQDPSTQIGAFLSLSRARRCARAHRGYKVYAPNGEIIM